MKQIFLAALVTLPTFALAESFEARSLRMLVNDPSFIEYVSRNENSQFVKLQGIRLAERAKPGERMFWYLDFEGGTRPEFAKIFCLGHATTGEFDVAFDMDLPVDCRIARFQE